MGTSDVLKVLKIARAVGECNLRTIKTSPCWLSIISYPTRARGIIVNYTMLYEYCKRRAETFFGTTFFPVHKYDSRDLGSTSLKMAAGSTLSGALKYVYPDRHLYGESERRSFTVAKGERNMYTQATDKTVVPEISRTCGHQKVVPKHVHNKQQAIFWDHFGANDLVMEKVRTILSEASVYFSKLSNAFKPASSTFICFFNR